MKFRPLRWSKEIAKYLLLAIVITTAVDLYRAQYISTEIAPDLVAVDEAGNKVDVIELSYQTPVVIYFWATWCPVCKFVSPTLDWISQYYPVVAVSGASGSDERVEAFKRQHGYQFTNVNDQNSHLFQQWGISVTPTIFIVKDGKIESITTGITTPPGLVARLWLNQ